MGEMVAASLSLRSPSLASSLVSDGLSSSVDEKGLQTFYRGKKVMITGHTGFKGSWLSVVLSNLGAKVVGFSSCSKEEIRLFDLCGIEREIIHIKGNIQNFQTVLQAFQEHKPEIVIHMAAQPLVRFSYENPLETYATNVMGTVHVLEAVRRTGSVKSVVNVTTDKVYENKEWCWGYRENEPLDGFDPYSNSKSCSELVTHAYIRSFFSSSSPSSSSLSSSGGSSSSSSSSGGSSSESSLGIRISTARAGNVIGGGDFAKDRIIPDCVRAAIIKQPIVVRNPSSIRPYQHVLEPLFAYLRIAQEQYENVEKAGYYNVGPDEKDCVSTRELVELFCKEWGEGLSWINKSENNAPHEANFLKLDCSRMKSVFKWKPRWGIKKAIEKTIEWSKVWQSGKDVREIMNKQIEEFVNATKSNME